MEMDVVVKGKAFVNGRFEKCCIGITDGKIAAVKKVLSGDKNIDLGDLIILPAGIDSHVHFRDPGYTNKEDFGTGTTAAAFGGISCVIDMPNTRPPVTAVDALREKIKNVKKKAFVDFGLFAGVGADSDLHGLSRESTAFKVYLASTTGDMLMTDEDVLKRVFSEAHGLGKVVAVHAENNNIIKKYEERSDSLPGHLAARSNKAELTGIEFALRLMGKAKAHICHVSSKEGGEFAVNTDATTEVTPHHLFLDSDMPLGSLGKVNPPLRKKKDARVLWHLLETGKIDIVASDHAPHKLHEKETDFAKAPAGIPGVETLLPLLLYSVKKKQLSFNHFVEAVSQRPAEIFGFNKGRIAVGFDADLIAVDMKRVTKIKGRTLHSKCGWSPFEGFDAIFPHMTMVRGEIVMKEHNLVGKRGYGKYLH